MTSESDTDAGREREEGKRAQSTRVLSLTRLAAGLTTCPVLTICMGKADVWGEGGWTLGPAPILQRPTHADGLALPINTLIALGA